MMKHTIGRALFAAACVVALAPSTGRAQIVNGSSVATSAIASTPGPNDYIIGPDDVLGIVFWRDKDLSSEAVVRPDGKISLPLLNDIDAAGLTPARLRARLMEEARRYVEDPNVTVVVRQINSRKVFVTGEIAKPGSYPLSGRMTVLQVLAVAGGLKEYADASRITVMRLEKNRTVRYTFNYNNVSKGKDLRQNLELMPGDTIVVP